MDGASTDTTLHSTSTLRRSQGASRSHSPPPEISSNYLSPNDPLSSSHSLASSLPYPSSSLALRPPSPSQVLHDNTHSQKERHSSRATEGYERRGRSRVSVLNN